MAYWITLLQSSIQFSDFTLHKAIKPPKMVWEDSTGANEEKWETIYKKNWYGWVCMQKLLLPSTFPSFKCTYIRWKMFFTIQLDRNVDEKKEAKLSTILYSVAFTLIRIFIKFIHTHWMCISYFSPFKRILKFSMWSTRENFLKSGWNLDIILI